VLLLFFSGLDPSLVGYDECCNFAINFYFFIVDGSLNYPSFFNVHIEFSSDFRTCDLHTESVNKLCIELN
jgi:hypothetical protein